MRAGGFRRARAAGCSRWQRCARLVLVLALVLGAAGAVTTMSAVHDSATAAPSPPADPGLSPGVNEYAMLTTTNGGIVAMAFPPQPTLDAGGHDVGLGGIYRCGDLGCIVYGVSWALPPNVTVVTGCAVTDWNCTVRYSQVSIGDHTTWSPVHATFGRGMTLLYAKDFFLWGPPVFFELDARLTDAGGRRLTHFELTGYGAVYAVRPGSNPTPADCDAPDWWRVHIGDVAPPVPTCVPLVRENLDFVTNFYFWTALPAGSGSWLIVASDNQPSGSIVANPARRFALVNSPAVGSANVAVDVPLSSGGTTTTTSPTTSSTTSPTTTSTTVVASAPQPPVPIAATVGDSSTGKVLGTVQGPPGATVTVTIAAGSVPPPGPDAVCPRTMSGTGATTVGSDAVTLDSTGSGTFEVRGAVTAGTWFYGTASSGGVSAVGSCLAVPDHTPPGTTVTAVTAPAGAGRDRVEVGSSQGFMIGGYARVGLGAQADVRRISGFGSIIFAAPLGHAHAVGSPVLPLSPPLGDTVAPDITVQSPSNQVVGRGALLTAVFVCTDAGVGVETCGGSLASGTPLDTSILGTHTVTITAWDANGNLASSTVSYTVDAMPPVPTALAGADARFTG